MFFLRSFDGSFNVFGFLIEIISLLGIALIFHVIYLGFFRKPKILEGKIINKQHHKESKQLLMIPIVISNGKTTTTTMTPMWITHPESWSVVIQNWDKEKQKYVSETFYLSNNVYDTVKTGDWFKFDNNLHLKERPEIRENAK